MRMWFISPKLLCSRHIRGEHQECHCAYKAYTSGNFNCKGFVNGLVDFIRLKDRHDELVAEMKARGWKHDDLEIIENVNLESAPININHNLDELKIRCKDCRELINNECRE